jgi:aryl-alcohol dehydrogenase-like predicted oxidoreductase
MRQLGRSGVRVSELCLGAMNFGNPRFGCDEASSRRVIDAFLDAGGNFIDTADAYSGGVSEQIVGRAVAPRRDAIVVATKGFYPVTEAFGDPPAHVNALGSSRRHLMAACEASLKRLGLDHVDLYQVHCWDPGTPLEETLSAMDDLVRQGKVRYWGVSNWSAWQVAEGATTARWRGSEPFVTAQMQWSLACRDIEQDVVPACDRHGVGLLPWSPLAQGVLTGKYLGQGEAAGRLAGPAPNAATAAWRERFLNERSERVARAVADCASRIEATPTAVSLAWLLRQRSVSSVVIGPKTPAQLAENVAACDVVLPEPEAARLEEVSAPPPRYPEWFIAGSPRA